MNRECKRVNDVWPLTSHKSLTDHYFNLCSLHMHTAYNAGQCLGVWLALVCTFLSRLSLSSHHRAPFVSNLVFLYPCLSHYVMVFVLSHRCNHIASAIWPYITKTLNNTNIYIEDRKRYATNVEFVIPPLWNCVGIVKAYIVLYTEHFWIIKQKLQV